MSETNNKGGKKLTLGKPLTLELNKSVDAGQVKQSFSHGRSKTVTVEVKRKRTFERGDSGDMKIVKRGSVAKVLNNKTEAINIKTTKQNLNDGLSQAERQRRIDALAGREKEEERRNKELANSERRAEEVAAKRATETAKKISDDNAEKDIEAKKSTDAIEKQRVVEDNQRKENEEIAKASAEKLAAKLDDGSTKSKVTPKAKLVTAEIKKVEVKKTTKARGEPRRRQSKLTITQALEGDDEFDRGRSMAALKRQREKEKMNAREQRGRNEKIIREVVIPETITVGDLANRMAERSTDIVKSLMKMGVMASQSQIIDADTAELVVEEFGHNHVRVADSDVELGIKGDVDNDADMITRPPVVTIMGHVDHGKTSLLDALRSTDVAAGEAGGITQHIGAYQVKLASGNVISFLDTPGHEAFTQMRMRGAVVTDIVVLVVAADDGLQPQTREAIAHSKAAGVPIIVAINKCDKEGADPQRVRTQLLEEELVVEEMGGDIQTIEVSATKKMNLDKLEEAILLQAEILELKANPNRMADGAVIESKLEKGRGSVATVLIQRGTLKIGDIFVVGSQWGRVRALLDDKGCKLKQAGPSMPVEVLGLQGTPCAGDEFVVMNDETRVREVAEYRMRKGKEIKQAVGARGTMEQMFSQIKAGEIKEMPVVIKTDVQGSLEAITAAMEKMATEEVKIRVLMGAVGGLTESDIGLAASTGGIALGFNVRANPQAREMARRDGVDIHYYSVIYDLIDDLKKLLGGLLAPEIRETFLGYAEIREVFNITKTGKIGGCYVTEGQVKRGAKVRLLRDNIVIHTGTLKTLRRFKDNVKEVKNNFECGMAFENYDDIKAGDVIECFDVESIAREL